VIDQIHAQLRTAGAGAQGGPTSPKPARTSNANWRWSRSPAPATRVEALRRGRRVPRQGGRHHHAKLRVRTDRRPDKIDSFVSLMRELGLVEVGRTGMVGMMRGPEGA
jgi:hypothetical protein